MLRIGHIPGKGRGVFASKDFKKGELIECSPMIIIPPDQVTKMRDTILSEYLFALAEGQCAMALGYGSLYNHSYHPNAVYSYLLEQISLEILALVDIQEGQEITVNYNGYPESKKPMWFHVNE